MRFTVRHETHYAYAVPVAFGSHILRLTPRGDGARVLSAGIEISPGPVSRRDYRDAHGNPVTEVAFEGFWDRLSVVSTFTAEALRPPGLTEVLPPLPWVASAADGTLPARPAAAPVGEFAHGLAAEAGWRAEDFLDLLNRSLRARTNRHIRPEGYARTAAETLAIRSGACRDLAVLFIEAARSLGIPARFVSGYQAKSAVEARERHLHAWPEVRLPGAGWRGYDPTHGTRVGGAHIALAAAPDQAGTMPIEGGYFGAAVESTLDYKVVIDAV